MQRNINGDNRLIPETTHTIANDASGRNGPQKLILIALLIIVCTSVFVTHLPVLSARALLSDDGQYLVYNLLVNNPSWNSAWRFITEIFEPSSVAGYYQPLTMMSLMFDCALGGSHDNLMPFHRTSLLLHVCNTALVVVLLYLLFDKPWIAAGTALLFGLHPMTVEPIAWVSDRKTVLASFFVLWSLILYVRFTRASKSKARWGCLVMYVLALMSKPTSIPLPVLMLLMDYWPLRRLNRAAVSEKLPLFGVGWVFAIVIYISQSRTAGVVLPNQYGPGRIPLVICYNIVFYLSKILWPANLSPYYPFHQPMTPSHPEILIGIIGTCILVSLLLVSLRWTKVAITGWLFFFMAILPTMQIIGFTRVIAADKFAYLPSLGLMMSLAALLGSLWITAPGRQCSLSNVMLTVCITVVAGSAAIGTRKYLRHWRDSVSLHEHMLALAPNEAPLYNDFGIALIESPSQINDAIYAFRRAVEIDPRSLIYRLNLGRNLAKVGQLKEALSYLRDAVRLNNNYIPALNQLAWLLATHPDPNIHDSEESLRLAKRAAHLTGHRRAGILGTLAAAWAANGHFDEAISTAKNALWLTSKTNEKELAGRITEQLEFYNQGKPYREDPTWPEMKSHTDVSQEELRTKDEKIKETTP